MELVKEITKVLEGDVSKIAEADRLALLQASSKLTETLEQPFERFFRMLFSIYEVVIIRVALDLGLIDIVNDNGGSATIAQLAEASKAEPNLVQRIVRMLVPLGILSEHDDGTYSTMPLAAPLVEGSPLKEGIVHFSHLYSAIGSMPEYFAANKYQNPKDVGESPFSFAHNTIGKSYFDFIATPGNERLNKAFNVTMAMQKGGGDEQFVVSYPANERLKIDDPERVLFVDVGGGVGHQLVKFQKSFPDLPGKYVLEELPDVVKAATDLPASVIKVGHDFFKPQPDAVKNAKAFYLRTVLHDWPEKQAHTILRHIVDAMADDSVVLINEVIMAERGVSLTDAKMDWHMMTVGALERTEKQWAQLGESVGLKINGIWWEKQLIGSRGLIEMSKK